MSKATRPLKKAIIGVVREIGKAEPLEIRERLGVKPDKRVYIQQKLAGMVEWGSLVVEDGVYSVSPSYELRGVDLFDCIESDIVKFLRGEPGQGAETKRIHDACGFREANGDYGHRLIHRVLRDSALIEDRGDAIWGLAPTALTS